MHWSDEIVDKLIKRGGEHVIETGTSISGIPHIGNASDVIRGDCVRKALEKMGVKAELIWVSDDSDPFRKVPAGMETLKDYIGFPVKDIPAPDGSGKNLVEHLANPFIEDLKKFGVNPKIYSGTELYRRGMLLEQIKTSFEKKEKISEILNKFRREDLSEEWIPWTPVCEGCGRISTTKATGLDGLKVSYVCETTKVSGGTAEGCGHTGISDAEKGSGKLPWRVEWAARWARFKVTCEPFGKEHAAPGGSYDTSKILCEEIFNWDAPAPVIYEFFTLNGAKISSSKGNVIDLKKWLTISQPEILKYFMYKRLQKSRDINLRMLPNLNDEYDLSEKAFFNGEENDSTQLYQLSQVGEPKRLNVPFTLCSVLSQIATIDEVAAKISKMGYTCFDENKLKERIRLAGNWVEEYGPEYLKFELNNEEESKRIFNEQVDEIKNTLQILTKELDEINDSSLYHKRIYEVARENGVEPPQVFTAMYQILIGKEKGPKAASFLQSLGKEYLEKRFI